MMSVNRRKEDTSKREVTQWVCAAEGVKVARAKALTRGDGGKKVRVQRGKVQVALVDGTSRPKDLWEWPGGECEGSTPFPGLVSP